MIFTGPRRAFSAGRSESPVNRWTRCLNFYKMLAMKIFSIVLLCGMLLSARAAVNDAKEEQSVMATLEAMAKATIHKDVATLDKIYHPDLTYSIQQPAIRTRPRF